MRAMSFLKNIVETVETEEFVVLLSLNVEPEMSVLPNNVKIPNMPSVVLFIKYESFKVVLPTTHIKPSVPAAPLLP